jgi:hypothetical protein
VGTAAVDTVKADPRVHASRAELFAIGSSR